MTLLTWRPMAISAFVLCLIFVAGIIISRPGIVHDEPPLAPSDICDYNAAPRDAKYCNPLDQLHPHMSKNASAVEHKGDIDIKSVVDDLPSGEIIYNRASELWLDIPSTVILKIGYDGELSPTLPAWLPGNSVSATTPLTKTMSVELQGTAGLLIEPKGIYANFAHPVFCSVGRPILRSTIGRAAW